MLLIAKQSNIVVRMILVPSGGCQFCSQFELISHWMYGTKNWEFGLVKINSFQRIEEFWNSSLFPKLSDLRTLISYLIPDVRLHHDRLAVLAPESPGQDCDRHVVNALAAVDVRRGRRRRRRCRGAVGAVERRRGQVDLEGETRLKNEKNWW